jgi:hypothetical protein
MWLLELYPKTGIRARARRFAFSSAKSRFHIWTQEPFYLRSRQRKLGNSAGHAWRAIASAERVDWSHKIMQHCIQPP